ncbi:hypothetical protein N7466_008831 [Penicillium verhagenii]|uniref:uncharacterized protein n=1 Tax=Penicillium verhagenii TaxID=1562060 RepID=UPI002545541D|nr:uncharacterized protein N7466_008831 [Penicillium verhagenii]KAJ5924644.1 hypothetical protein N7466_008831 [Penicillium verhagenii]
MAYITLAALAAISAFILALRAFTVKPKLAKLPPGPKGRPIIGNLLDLPADGKQEWQHWLQHKELYGPLSSVTVLGQTVVIINDRDLAVHILEKNSVKHSSRPRLVFADELSGWGQAPVSQDNTPLLRSYRRAMARIIGSQASASKFDHLLVVEARRFLWRVLDSPQNFVQHIRTAAGAFVLKITYGYEIVPHGADPLVNLADLALEQFSKAVVPGAWLVDMIPALKYIPEWAPGAGFKKTANYYLQTLRKLTDDPLKFTKYQMSKKSHQPSFVSELLSQGESEDITKWAAAALYGGGADTTVSALEGLFLAMMLFPDVQRKAQEELDRVFGGPALPTVEDRARLPYINAIVKEALRWHVVAPLGVPHRTDEDDVVDGFLIPKNALLLPNIWSFNHDPAVYPNPMEFRPERYLPEEGQDAQPDPHDTSFGYGRRLCPGRIVADTSLYLTIVSTLATFNITKPIGEDGQEIEPPVDFTPGIISHPVPYACSFTPRSEKHKALILDFERETPFENSDAEALSEALKCM